MPMKAMVYKTLSTVIDDLFAWVFKFLDPIHLAKMSYGLLGSSSRCRLCIDWHVSGTTLCF
jgi:hypothetical protein